MSKTVKKTASEKNTSKNKEEFEVLMGSIEPINTHDSPRQDVGH